MNPLRIVCFTAHPDDETVFAGATLALLARGGAEVRVLCATRGEGGEAGLPPLCARSELGAVREAELRCAARALGCAGVDFLGYRDPDVGADGSLFAYSASGEEVAARAAEVLRTLRPDAVITHGSSGEYGHPAHALTHRAGVEAARRASVPALFTFGAFFENHPRPRSANQHDAADLVVDISSTFEEKLAALECHRTQAALFVRRPSAEAGRPVALRDAPIRIESFHEVWPAGAPDPVGDEIRRLLGTALMKIV